MKFIKTCARGRFAWSIRESVFSEKFPCEMRAIVRCNWKRHERKLGLFTLIARSKISEEVVRYSRAARPPAWRSTLKLRTKRHTLRRWNAVGTTRHDSWSLPIKRAAPRRIELKIEPKEEGNWEGVGNAAWFASSRLPLPRGQRRSRRWPPGQHRRYVTSGSNDDWHISAERNRRTGLNQAQVYEACTCWWTRMQSGAVDWLADVRSSTSAVDLSRSFPIDCRKGAPVQTGPRSLLSPG